MPSLQIDKLAYGGSGFGRLDGKACFVPFAAPGDLINVRIEKNKSSYSEGVVAELISKSKERVEPPCPVFGVCGGCNWQHVSYKEQCRQKENIFAETLWRSARIDKEKIKPILSAAAPFGYRQRIQLKVNYSGSKLSLGFNRRSSHFVVDIGDRCAIAANPINQAIPEIRDIIQSFKEPDSIPQVDLASTEDDSVSALFHYIGENPGALAGYLAAKTQNSCRIRSISMQTGRKDTFRHVMGLEKLKYAVSDSRGRELELFYSPESFSQVNFSQNRVLVQTLLDYCSKIPLGSILDLFCGNGNFSLPLASMAHKVLGLESVEKSIALANDNALANDIKNAQYLCIDSAAGIADLIRSARHFDLVILDPPRTGAEEVAKSVHGLSPAHLIYISCDPPTLARDLSTLRKCGFEVIHAQPVDMFPQTYHLESIVFLKAN